MDVYASELQLITSLNGLPIILNLPEEWDSH